MTETSLHDSRTTALSAKVCIAEGPHFNHEKRIIDYLWEKAGGTIPAMIAHSLPFYYCDAYLGKQRILFSPRVEMTLEEILRNPVGHEKLLAHQKEMLMAMLRVVRPDSFFRKSK